MKKKELDFWIPYYLEHDIDGLIEATNTDSSVWDCWWDEVYGSINMAMSSGAITEEQAEMLRNYYLRCIED